MFRKRLMLVVAATLLASVPSAASAAAPVKPKPVLVVIGDSISAESRIPHALGGYRYNDTSGDKDQAWWSIMRRRTGYRAKVFAIGGSGWNKKARGCKLDAYTERVKRPEVRKELARAKVIFIHGGVNDTTACDSTLTLSQAMQQTLASVREVAPKTPIVVGEPWGDATSIQAHRVTTLRTLRRVAVMYRATYVTIRLTRKQTYSGVHPNRAGSLLIADKFQRHGGLATLKH